MRIDNQTGVLFVSNGLIALAFSFVLPIMSLFLVSELNAEPAFIGIYTSLTALTTVFVSQKLTGLVDHGVSSKLLFLLSLIGIISSMLAFSIASEFWHALLIGCTLMPIASSSIPLILTIIRNYADSTGKNSARLNSQMRSSMSFLWIFGPPLAFMSIDRFGFASNFHIAASIALFTAIFTVVLLRTHVPHMDEGKSAHGEKLPRSVWLLGGIVMLTNLANSTYVNSMPIHVTQELQLSTSYPGLMLGLAAGIEIPAMLFAVNWAQRFGKMRVLKASFLLGAIFYCSMFLAESFDIFIMLQLFNGLFYGIFVGLGITIMQDFAPNSIGKASAFYSNAMLVGSMLGSVSMGVISQYFGFKAPLLLSLVSVFLCLLGLVIFERYEARHVLEK